MTWIRGIQVTAILLLTGVAANAQLLRDDFDVLHDYSTGTVPAGGIWSGVHNSTNGGDAVTPGFFVANGTDAFGGSKAGVLFIEDLNLHANTNGNLGTGWEPAWTNAPFLYTEVPADKNFEVTTKIDNQTTGFWASSGILARVKGDPVGQGLGDAISGFNSAAVASFYPAEDNHQIQLQIIRPNETGTAAVEDENNAAVPVAGIFPLYLRMVKEGPTFTSWASEDGTNWSQYNGLEVNAALAESGKTLEVGLYNTRYGGSAGDVDFDFFEINITDPVTVTSATWIVDSAGNWNNFANWDANVAGAIPNNNQVAVLFGSAITAPKTVYSDSAVAAKSITFDNANKYAVAGTGGVTLAANTGSASLIVSQGSHEFQTSLTLASNTTANAAANTKLDINNTLDLGGHTLTISGGGQVNINNDVVSGNG
ncbi:MAG: hypothetical protein KDA99_29995, partial [Planctomycetales bacterium]|nr:hypothetical protein [Planctomycetales bacterium]